MTVLILQDTHCHGSPCRSNSGLLSLSYCFGRLLLQGDEFHSFFVRFRGKWPEVLLNTRYALQNIHWVSTRGITTLGPWIRRLPFLYPLSICNHATACSVAKKPLLNSTALSIKGTLPYLGLSHWVRLLFLNWSLVLPTSLEVVIVHFSCGY